MSLRLHMEQGDVPLAFLNLRIDADVYMMQPEGFIKDINMVCKLNKGLYGLKQASRLWYEDINQYITKELGFIRFKHNQCIYSFKADLEMMIIIIYIDNIIVASPTKHLVEQVMNKLY